MAERLNRGEIWLLERPRPDKRRPVLILLEEGLKDTSCVNLCNLFTVRKAELRTYVGTVGREKMRAVCQALELACACE